MSGHSKWATIKRKKAAVDAKRGKIFTRLIREIMIAAREGGGDPEANSRLRTAINNAKSENMPMDNIERAIKRGTGELEGVNYEESWYEAYAPGGVGLYIQVLTDNKNRTVAEIRHLLTRNNASMAEAGAVAWMFEQKGVITIDASTVDEDQLMEIALEAGADDLESDENVHIVKTAPADLHPVQAALEEHNVAYLSAEITYLPKNEIELDAETGQKVMKLLDVLEDHDDVQNVYHNADFPEALLAEEG
ncbi:MAG: YebC/PmpR family DNA-binding transcriptional regulator [Gemmatimonadetes bacterium]|nr:MAG: YebC/PmpR family DNA-binding transcriptional regulator [Gemmatimonadota bacterium]